MPHCLLTEYYSKSMQFVMIRGATMCITIFLALLGICDGYKILLFFPIPGKSHSILGESYVRHLLKAGHEVTYITPITIQNPPPGLRQVDVSQNAELLPGEIFNIQKLMYKEIDLQEIYIIRAVVRDCLNGTLQSQQMQKFLHDNTEQYDAVIVEWLFSELGAGLSAVFNCPLIWSTSTEVHSDILSLIGESLNPAYSVYIWGRDYSLSFYHRVKHLWILLKEYYDIWKHQAIDNEIYNNAYRSAVESRGSHLPSFDEVRYNGSLMLGNSHISAGDAHALPQAYKMIGGYHITDTLDPLPKDLQKIMDESKHGVIFFSLGTMLRSSALPDKKKKDLLTAFSSLKQTVIWKYEKPINNLPKNVHVVHWAPQPSILGHPNTVLFITHGGLLSLYEDLNFGIPLIGIPMFGDQFSNVNRAVNKGFAKRFDIGEEPVDKLLDDIKEILENPKYRERAKEMSLIFHSRLVPPGVELVYWVEHVVQTRGAPHLRSPALHMPLYQKCYLDLLAVVLVLLTAISYVLRKIFKRYYMNSIRSKKDN